MLIIIKSKVNNISVYISILCVCVIFRPNFLVAEFLNSGNSGIAFSMDSCNKQNVFLTCHSLDCKPCVGSRVPEFVALRAGGVCSPHAISPLPLKLLLPIEEAVKSTPHASNVSSLVSF